MPRPTTWEDYQQRIARVTAHVEQHLDEPCSLEELARIAAFSPCHFHRVFRAVTGEGVAEYRRRLRLERAARRLRLTTHPVVDIAVEAGYDAHDSFTRAFETVYGLAPSHFRAERGLGHSKGAGAELPKVLGTVERIGPLQLVFMRHYGPYEEVGETFNRLTEWVESHGLFGPWTQALGLCHDDPEVVDPERLRYDAAYSVGHPVEVAGDVEYRELQARDYLKAVHSGPFSTLGESYAAVIRGYLLHHSRPLADGEGSLEFYVNSPEGSSAESLATEICLPLMAVNEAPSQLKKT